MKHLRLALVGLLVVGACADTPTDVSRLDSQMAVNTAWGDDLFGATAVFPSTNEINATYEWATVEFLDLDIGAVTLTFTQPRSFAACFEYRVDGEAPTYTPVRANYNTEVTDGLWNSYCQNADARTETIMANQYVDVRMAFGAEKTERFGWTRFYAPTREETKALCKDGGWETAGFTNMGQCVRFAETGYDGR
jgi:hypothetical protein